MKTEEKSEKINRILGIISAVIGIVGSIFGIFQAQQAATLKNEVNSLQTASQQTIVNVVSTLGDDAKTSELTETGDMVAATDQLISVYTTKNHNHTPFACHCDKVGGPLFFCFIHIILSVVHRAWWSSGGRAAYSWGSCW